MKYFWAPWLVGIALGLAFIVAAGAADFACYAHTPDGPTCAQDPNGDGCYGGLHSMQATDAGR